MTSWLRNNIGAITSTIGLIILVLLMYGNPLEINTKEYWLNVQNNIMSLSLLGFGLTLVNATIKQGISEQALSAGLNTETTKSKFETHKALIKKNAMRQNYLQAFLKQYNERETAIRRDEFLNDNDITVEVFKKPKLTFKEKILKKKYLKIKTIITASSIKWATTDIKYDKKGRIKPLNNFRIKRGIKGFISAAVMMFGMTLIARGLFTEMEGLNWLAQTGQLFVYLLTIMITSVFDVIKNYEKGAFGVPNELDDINAIWDEFSNWSAPVETVKQEEKVNGKENIDTPTNLQKESNEVKNIQNPSTNSVLVNDSKHYTMSKSSY